MQSPNPYAPPASSLATRSEFTLEQQIEALAVSPAWKARFTAIALAGGARLPHFKQLSKKQRQQAMRLNVLAFLFGPFYYASKGMWKKGLVYVVLTGLVAIAIGVTLDYLGYGQLARGVSCGLGAWYGLKANVDFYKKMVEGENGWW